MTPEDRTKILSRNTGETARGREAPQVVAERARVRRRIESGNAGQDAHTRALAGRQTMDIFRSKLISL